MAVLIDASILIESERGRLDLERHVAQRQQEEFLLSVVTASELLHGVHRATQPEVRIKRSAFVEAILERFPLLPVDLATVRTQLIVHATCRCGSSCWLAYGHTVYLRSNGCAPMSKTFSTDARLAHRQVA